MALENGIVNNWREGCLVLQFQGTLFVECVIDTGFSGELVLPRDVVDELQLIIFGQMPFEVVSGAQMSADFTEVKIRWLGEDRMVDVIVSESDDALIGTALLDGARLTIDYLANTVSIFNN
jgi:clan AA aspartic protease